MSAPAALTPSPAVISIPTPPPDGDEPSFFRNPFHAARSAMNYSSHQNNHTAGGIVSPCPDCGNDVVHPYLKELQQAQTRVAELEEHIKTLTLRATTAMEKATEYETSLKRMNSLSSAGRSTPDPAASSALETQSPPASQPTAAASPERAPSRGALSRLLPTRMPSLRSVTSSPALSAASPQARPPPQPLAESAMPSDRPKQFPLLAHTPPTPVTATYIPSSVVGPANATDLQARLDQEQKLRRAAEAESEKTQSEIVELTEKLFGEANKLVADERRARDRLEKRVEVLERRDQEKNKRLGMLDMRVQRIERVRQILSEKVITVATDDRDEREDSPQREVAVKA